MNAYYVKYKKKPKTFVWFSGFMSWGYLWYDPTWQLSPPKDPSCCQTTDELSLPHHCWRQTLYSTGRLIRLGIPPPPHPPSLQSPCGTSLGCDVNVISFHMALQRANVTAESCSALSLLSLPTFLSAACLSVLVWMGGGGVGGVS